MKYSLFVAKIARSKYSIYDDLKRLVKVAESDDIMLLKRLGEEKMLDRGGQHNQLFYSDYFIRENDG